MTDPYPVEIDEADFDVTRELSDLREYFTLEPAGDGRWTGSVLAGETGNAFGGFILAQAVAATIQAADPDDDRRLISAHGHFLRPIAAEQPTDISIDVLKNGHMFAHRRVDVSQNGKVGFAMTATFGGDGEGYVYDLPSNAPVPDRSEFTIEEGPPGWIQVWIGATEPRADGTMVATNRKWIKVPAELPDDPKLHTALLAYCTDWTGIGGRPLNLDGDITGMVSLDHAVWFHRPARADEWLYLEVYSLVNAGGRGTLRGAIYNEAGQVVVSMAQEMLLAVI